LHHDRRQENPTEPLLRFGLDRVRGDEHSRALFSASSWWYRSITSGNRRSMVAGSNASTPVFGFLDLQVPDVPSAADHRMA